MITSTNVKDDNNPYLTRIEDQDGKTILLSNSSTPSDYLSPRQLLQAALAGCLSMTVRGELTRAGLSYENVEVKVDMEDQEGKTKFVFHIEVESGDDPELVEACRKKAAERCYIRGLLTDGILIEEKELLETEQIESERCCGL